MFGLFLNFPLGSEAQYCPLVAALPDPQQLKNRIESMRASMLDNVRNVHKMSVSRPESDLCKLELFLHRHIQAEVFQKTDAETENWERSELSQAHKQQTANHYKGHRTHAALFTA